MKYAALIANGVTGNTIFDRNNPLNRDDCFAPYSLLKDMFISIGIQINTADIQQDDSLIFELHQDVQESVVAKYKYLMLFETEFVKNQNADFTKLLKYRKIFTWNDDLVDGKRFIKINFPNPIQNSLVDGFLARNHFCCLISGNKTLSVIDERDLYIERIKTIRWFELNAPMDFDLYGNDWHIPAWGRANVGKFTRRIFKLSSKLFKMQPFPSYKGRVEHKRDVLTKTRFAICYENVRDLPGYVTEKIFDCFFSGCIPVYWGASNITQFIPADCFIDRRKFQNTEAVYVFLKAMKEQEFVGYQQRIAAFLQSDAAYPFSAEFFAETITKTIVQDLGI
jgi:hypothetical protein